MEFRDLKAQYQVMRRDINTAIQGVIDDANFISGCAVRDLEKQLAEYVGVKFCVTCGNGTDALVLSLMAWGIGKGDAVFVPDFTFFASGEAPAVCGATPVFVDVDRDTFNVSPKDLEEAIIHVLDEGKLQPKVIIAVDLFGQSADYGEIKKIADKYHLLILEDGAQGFGGRIREKMACSFGDISTTSFFPAKPLGCYGDGGAVFTDNEEWAEIIRSLCVHGKGMNKYDNIRIGMNSRLDTIQAAILQVKFKEFQKTELKSVNRVAEWYNKYLSGGDVIVPRVLNGHVSSWAQYTIICCDRIQRDKIKSALQKESIPSIIYYEKALHEQKAFENNGYQFGEYCNTLFLKDRVLSLPMHPYLKEKQVKKIVEVVQSIKSD